MRIGEREELVVYCSLMKKSSLLLVVVVSAACAFAIAVSWEALPGGSLALRATVPVNTAAHIGVPTLGRDSVTVLEGDTIVWEKNLPRELPAGIAAARAERQWIVFDVGSGDYCFTLK